MAVKLIPINSEQFVSALRIRDISERNVQEALGRSSGYLTNVKHRGSISLPDAKMIQAFFDIPMDEYVSETSIPKKDRRAWHKCDVEVDSDALRQAIKSKGISLAKVSNGLGRSHSFMDHVLRKGHTDKATANMISTLYDIPLESFVISEMKKNDPFPIVIEDDEPKLTSLKKVHELFTNEIHNRDEKAMEQGVCVSEKEELVYPVPSEKDLYKPDNADYSKPKDTDVTFKAPDMPIFVNISINVEIKTEDSKVPEIDYRRLKSDTYNAVYTGVFDGMARWNRR